MIRRAWLAAIGKAVPGVRVVDHQHVTAGAPGRLGHQRSGLLQGRPDQVRGGDLAQVPEQQEPELGVDAGDTSGRPGLAGTGAAGEDEVLPGRPRDRRADLAAGLLHAQDRDRPRKLFADRLQARETGQPAHVLSTVAVEP